MLLMNNQVKIFVIGRSKSGKTLVSKYLQALTKGNLRLEDASTFWMHSSSVKIEKRLKAWARIWHKERRSKNPSKSFHARAGLLDIYNKFGEDIVLGTFEKSDIYAGLRQPEVLESVRQELEDSIIPVCVLHVCVSAPFKETGIEGSYTMNLYRKESEVLNLMPADYSLANIGTKQELKFKLAEFLKYLRKRGVLQEKEVGILKTWYWNLRIFWLDTFY